MPNLKPGDLIAGKYRIIRAIGRGGMGVVYQAEHERMSRRVAVKVLHNNFGNQRLGIARFEKEIKAMSLISNAHVARALDADVLEDGSLYLVMEYLEGRDLRTELRVRRTIPYPEAVAYVMQACDGVAAAHDVGIVHRDLKPQNMFLTQLEASRNLKVLDFGLAKFLQAEVVSLTTTDMTVGTPLYMSPEQLCRPQDVSTRSDVWALGVVLYELIVGASPFQAESPGAVVAAVVLEEPIALTDAMPDVPKQIGEVLADVFTKSPATRLGSARELAERLAPFGMPCDAIRVSVSKSLSNYPATMGRITARPELSERIKNEVAAYEIDHKDSRRPAADGLSELPILSGIELPLRTARLSAPIAQIQTTGGSNDVPATTTRTPGRGRKVAWILGAIATTASIVVYVAQMHRAEPKGTAVEPTTPRSLARSPLPPVSVPPNVPVPLTPIGTETTATARALSNGAALQRPTSVLPHTTRAHAKAPGTARLTPPAVPRPVAPAAIPTAADGKPLHL